MGSVCSEQKLQHKFYHSHQLYLNKKILRGIDIPPRKLLSSRATAAAACGTMHVESDTFMDSPKAEEAFLQKFLPYNNIGDDDADPYLSDHFRMYEFKVRKCTRSRSHDWTECPFSHPGEKARRRDPRRYRYSGTICSEFRRGNCSRGDNCEFAHGVFECWLHPSRYRTEACRDGKNCERKVCFFAHSPRQVRVLPANCHETAPSPVYSPVKKKQHHRRNANHCCMYCHSHAASPTSTLTGMSHLSPPLSPSLSPPLSPMKAAKFSPIRYKDQLGTVEPCGMAQFSSRGMSRMNYEDALAELMNYLEAMRVSESSSHASAINNGINLPWLDVNFTNDDQKHFILSARTPSPGTNKFLKTNYPSENFIAENKYSENGLAGPDIGWVNDLLT